MGSQHRKYIISIKNNNKMIILILILIVMIGYRYSQIPGARNKTK